MLSSWHERLHAVIGLGDRGRGEGVGLDDVGAGLEIAQVNVADGLGLRQRQQIVVALEILRPILEAALAEIAFANLSAWICVPMAPSSTRMRSFAARASASATLEGSKRWAGTPSAKASSSRGRDLDRARARLRRAKADQMADRIDEIGAVHRVEMDVGHAPVDEVDDLLGADGGGDEAARRHIVVEPGEALGEPGRNARAGALGEIRPSA